MLYQGNPGESWACAQLFVVTGDPFPPSFYSPKFFFFFLAQASGRIGWEFRAENCIHFLELPQMTADSVA